MARSRRIVSGGASMPIYELDGQAPEFPGRRPLLGRRDRGADRPGAARRATPASGSARCCAATTNGSRSASARRSRTTPRCTPTPAFRMVIGANCVIGHKVMLHGCTVGDNSLIGMGAILLNGAKIGSNCTGRRRRAGHRGQELSRQLADRRIAGARHPHDRRQGHGDDRRRRRRLRQALAAIRQGAQADRLRYSRPAAPTSR